MGLLNAGGGLLLEVLAALGPDLLRRLADAFDAPIASPNGRCGPVSPAEDSDD